MTDTDNKMERERERERIRWRERERLHLSLRFPWQSPSSIRSSFSCLCCPLLVIFVLEKLTLQPPLQRPLQAISGETTQVRTAKCVIMLQDGFHRLLVYRMKDIHKHTITTDIHEHTHTTDIHEHTHTRDIHKHTHTQQTYINTHTQKRHT